jgi:phosphatidylglycerophosphate synthase
LIDQVDVHPSPIGKIATVFQLTSILWVLFRIPLFLHAMVFIAASLTLISGTGYVLDGIRQLRVKGFRL